MQRLAGEAIGQFCRRPKQLFRQASLATIRLIPNQPMARIGHMDADLMGAAGFKPAFHQAGSTLKVLNHTGTGHRVAALLPNHSLPLAVGLMPGEVSGDLQDAARLKADPAQAPQAGVIGVGLAVDDRQIAAVDRVILELCRQPVMGAVRFRDHQEPRCILVDAVDDARPPLAANARERIPAMGQ